MLQLKFNGIEMRWHTNPKIVNKGKLKGMWTLSIPTKVAEFFLSFQEKREAWIFTCTCSVQSNLINSFSNNNVLKQKDRRTLHCVTVAGLLHRAIWKGVIRNGQALSKNTWQVIGWTIVYYFLSQAKFDQSDEQQETHWLIKLLLKSADKRVKKTS